MHEHEKTASSKSSHSGEVDMSFMKQDKMILYEDALQAAGGFGAY